jgi:hypothetical protein
MNRPPALAREVPEEPEEEKAVVVRVEDRRPPNAAGDDVVDPVRDAGARRAWHPPRVSAHRRAAAASA